ncbi:MAG TPA: MFS transporter permease [Methanoregulaceae archaeon]|nr:MFS transporter permease [Methanolinea sp.]MDD3091528.1 MFS transporter permease [Methanoregulaceae archaeon]MDD5685076.1 MFS transporter permease [Methanoregulaceae archaeon]HOP67651.1 MFS transporter permease [Methanoregulaceae archaeon]HQC13422.1 MFS transporter permease [Methanoregulaceae archaeon]
MDYLGLGALFVGILFILMGIGLMFNIPQMIVWVEELAGFIALLIGIALSYFGYRLVSLARE